MRDFLDIKVGDIVVVYDEYNHDYNEHYIEVESVEYDDCNATETNPKGMTCYGKDLNWWNDRLQDYDGDDYITNVTETNFIRFKDCWIENHPGTIDRLIETNFRLVGE